MLKLEDWSTSVGIFNYLFLGGFLLLFLCSLNFLLIWRWWGLVWKTLILKPCKWACWCWGFTHLEICFRKAIFVLNDWHSSRKKMVTLSDLLLDCLGWYFLFVWNIFLLVHSPTPTQTSQSPHRLYLVLGPSAATFAKKLIFELQALFCLCQILMKLSEML